MVQQPKYTKAKTVHDNDGTTHKTRGKTSSTVWGSKKSQVSRYLSIEQSTPKRFARTPCHECLHVRQAQDLTRRLPKTRHSSAYSLLLLILPYNNVHSLRVAIKVAGRRYNHTPRLNERTYPNSRPSTKNVPTQNRFYYKLGQQTKKVNKIKNKKLRDTNRIRTTPPRPPPAPPPPSHHPPPPPPPLDSIYTIQY